ncbi:MAG: choice-of-anchor J domain-containing protein, partial [Clostridia bacterium]|nr:choice-of-anchor J domain-containing protein [Clostridia bacterium]
REGCFFWFAFPAAATQYADAHVLALDVESDSYVDLGSPGGGLYLVGMMGVYLDPTPYLPLSPSVDPVDFYDNFDSGFNWDVIDADGDGNNWITDYVAEGKYVDGSKVAISYSWNDIILYPDNWMISPEFEIGEGEKWLSFFTASLNSADGDISEHFQVIVIPQGELPENGTVVYEHTLDTNALEEHLVDLSAFAGQTVSLAFRHYDCFDQYTLIIDAVGVGNLK